MRSISAVYGDSSTLVEVVAVIAGGLQLRSVNGGHIWGQINLHISCHSDSRGGEIGVNVGRTEGQINSHRSCRGDSYSSGCQLRSHSGGRSTGVKVGMVRAGGVQLRSISVVYRGISTYVKVVVVIGGKGSIEINTGGR